MTVGRPNSALMTRQLTSTQTFSQRDEDACYLRTLKRLAFPSWGVDLIKYDNCYAPPLTVISDRNRCISSPWLYGQEVGNMWRTTLESSPGWGKVLADLNSNINLARFAGPGGWNDLDKIEMGQQSVAHLQLDKASLSILMAPEVIAVNQDPLGVAGDLVWKQGPMEVYAGPLAGSARAVVLFNRHHAGDVNVNSRNLTVSWTLIGICPTQTAAVRDLYLQQDLGSFTGSFTGAVKVHGVLALKITPLRVTAGADTWRPWLGIGPSCTGIAGVVRKSARSKDAKESGAIPHIIHQSWKVADVPKKYEDWAASWKTLHPGWEYRMWTDADNDALVEEHYPWFKDTYDSFPKPVMKADACRVLYMHHHGGMYADLDFEALRNTEPLLEGKEVLLASIWKDQTPAARPGTYEQPIPNAWMASVRHHPFWLFALQTMIKIAGQNDTESWDYVETWTGPVMLFRAIKAFERAGGTGLTILDPGVIYPIDWHDTLWVGDATPQEDALVVCSPPSKFFDDKKCKKRFPDAYAITYWSQSWRSK
ncbi:hypothetical protein WJX81_004379 [Elliptochloris bilobata]|uniref:alpha-galactosidase n=1 Tax=Elliptochloris bilobata TaxID=381761 RepID=A0AAW1RM49_9CHLO